MSSAAAQRLVDPKAIRRASLLWGRRVIERSTRIRKDDKAHILLWMEDIEAMVSGDPRHEALAMTACISYAHLVRVTAATLQRVKGGVDKDAQLAAMFTRYTTQLSRSLRLAGLPTTAQPRAGKTKTKASEFAPAARKASGSPDPETGEVQGLAEPDAATP